MRIVGTVKSVGKNSVVLTVSRGDLTDDDLRRGGGADPSRGGVAGVEARRAGVDPSRGGDPNRVGDPNRGGVADDDLRRGDLADADLTYNVASDAGITLNGNVIGLSELRPGDKVTLSNNEAVATRVSATRAV